MDQICGAEADEGARDDACDRENQEVIGDLGGIQEHHCHQDLSDIMADTACYADAKGGEEVHPLQDRHDKEAEDCAHHAICQGHRVSEEHGREGDPDEGDQRGALYTQTIEDVEDHHVGQTHLNAGNRHEEGGQEMFHVGKQKREGGTEPDQRDGFDLFLICFHRMPPYEMTSG